MFLSLFITHLPGQPGQILDHGCLFFRLFEPIGECNGGNALRVQVAAGGKELRTLLPSGTGSTGRPKEPSRQIDWHCESFFIDDKINN
jgi:hypothetical protein